MKNLILGLTLLFCSNFAFAQDTPEVPTLAQLQDSIKQLSDNDVALEKRIAELEKNQCKCDTSPKLGATTNGENAIATLVANHKLQTAVINDKPVTKAEVDGEMDKPVSMRDLVSMAAGYAMAEQEAKTKTAYSSSSYASAPAPVSNVVRSASGGSTGNVVASSPVYYPVASGGSTGSIPVAPSYETWTSVPDVQVSVPLRAGETLVPGSVRTKTVNSTRVSNDNGGLLGFGLLGNRRANASAPGAPVQCVDQFGNIVPCNR